MLDLLIRDARILDGTGGPEVRGDVGIAHGRITDLGGRIDAEAARVVEADGRVVSPGFIDMHSHVDLVLHDFPRADGMLRQGVTTIVTGNCGMSPFPRPLAEDGSRPHWDDLASFADAMDDSRLAINVAPLIGHGALRNSTMANPGGDPSPEEMAHMERLVETAMAQGAHGMSTGLIYDPGRFSTTDELVALAAVVARHGGFYASHIRGEDSRDTLVAAVAEAIEIGRRSGAPVQISHHKAKRRDNWGTVTTTLGMVDEAVAEGLDVLLDCYPYTASSTTLWAYVPHWARASELLPYGELPADLRARLIEELERMYPGCSTGNDTYTPLSDLTLAQVGDEPGGPFSEYQGLGFHQAAQQSGRTQADFLLDILMGAQKVQIVDHAMSADDVNTVLSHPRVMVGSDAHRVHPDIPGKHHPRNFGTYSRFLETIAPPLMSLEEAIFKCTGLPARRLGWTDRGVLAPGAAADLLLFDPAQVRDHSTFEDPKHYSTGFDLIVVGGTVVVEEDVDTGTTPGRFLLRS